MISNLDGGRQPNRVEPIDVFLFRCSLQGTLDFVRLVVVTVSGAIDVCDEFVEVVVNPVVFSKILFSVVAKIRRSAAIGMAGRHEEGISVVGRVLVSLFV